MMVDSLPRRGSLEFRGAGLQCLGYGLLYLLLSMTIVGIPWGLSIISKWFVENLVSSDGTRARWTGQGAQILLPYVVLLVAGGMYAAALSSQTGQPNPDFVVVLVPVLVLYLAVVPWVSVMILRWFFRSIVPTSGQSLIFRGGMLPNLGWMLLYILSIYTIIGWAFVSTGWLRWILRNVEVSDGTRARFVGGGFELLWRAIVASLGSIFVITYPWLMVWLLKWAVRNVELEHPASPSAA